jgi:Tfp pilus assembly protein PilX
MHGNGGGMKHALRAETGSSIVMAIVLMSMMFAVGMAAYAFVDTQQVESMRERHRESSFNFAEAALNSQSFILSRRWAGSQNSFGTATPTCSNTSAPTAMCPDPAQLTAAFASSDYAVGATWQTTVYDDVSGKFYDAAVVEVPATAHWDQNNNGTVWIKAETVVRSRPRRIVALVQVQPYQEQIPKQVIIAGQFELTPNGNGVYIKTNPDETSEHRILLRCNLGDPSCAEFTPDHKNPQLDPPGAIDGQSFVGEDALKDDVKDRLKERAVADGTYYSGPRHPHLGRRVPRDRRQVDVLGHHLSPEQRQQHRRRAPAPPRRAHDQRRRVRGRPGRNRRRVQPCEPRLLQRGVHEHHVVRQRQHRPELLARHHRRRVSCRA